MNNFNTHELNTLISNRRSVYPAMYSGEIIDDNIINQMLQNANWAPTHRLTQPWRFTVFTGEGINKLAEFQANLYKDVASAKDAFDEAKFLKLLKKPLLSSHIISIGMKRDAKKCVPEVEEIASVACAVQNIYLTATAYGIGCYWGSGGVTYYEEAKSFFGLKESDKLLGFLYLGMPKSKSPEGKRNPIEDKVNWVR